MDSTLSACASPESNGSALSPVGSVDLSSSHHVGAQPLSPATLAYFQPLLEDSPPPLLSSQIPHNPPAAQDRSAALKTTDRVSISVGVSPSGQKSQRGQRSNGMATIAMHRGVVDDALAVAPAAENPGSGGFSDAGSGLGDQTWDGTGLNPMDDDAASPFEMLSTSSADVSGGCI